MLTLVASCSPTHYPGITLSVSFILSNDIFFDPPLEKLRYMQVSHCMGQGITCTAHLQECTHQIKAWLPITTAQTRSGTHAHQLQGHLARQTWLGFPPNYLPPKFSSVTNVYCQAAPASN